MDTSRVRAKLVLPYLLCFKALLYVRVWRGFSCFLFGRVEGHFHRHWLAAVLLAVPIFGTLPRIRYIC